jgi:hypothetical protein
LTESEVTKVIFKDLKQFCWQKDAVEVEEDEEMEELDSDEWEEFEDEPIPVTGNFNLLLCVYT